MAKNEGIHWRSPALMLGALLVGIVLSIGHHLFYQSLAGKSMPVAGHNVMGVSKQKINASAGTAFAFLTKSCFAIAVSTAYIQLFWKAAKGRTTTVVTLDGLLSAMKNMLFLLEPKLWWKYPFLVYVALTIWLIPIATVITPATLTVETVPAPLDYSLMRMPVVDFNSLNFAFLPDYTNKADFAFVYQGPQYAVTKVATATAAQGSIMPLSAPHPNSSWILEFFGPAVTCDDVSTPLRDQILDQVKSVFRSFNCSSSLGYLSWLSINETNLLPYEEDPDGMFHLREASTKMEVDRLIYEEAVRGQPQVFVATFPGVIPVFSQHGTASCSTSTPAAQVANATLISCQLFNTSYVSRISFENGVQAMDIHDTKPYEKVIALDVVHGKDLTPSVNITYEDGSETQIYVYNTTMGRILAYQSVFDAFGKILAGVISSSPGSGSIAETTDTTIMSTVLSDTEELAFFNNYGLKMQYGMQQTMELEMNLASSHYHGIAKSVTEYVPKTMHMREALENLFQNITMGLMASPLLQPNYSSIYAPPPTNVTVSTYRNVYVYSRGTLWLAYGIAILVCSLNVIAGIIALFANGASYSCDFSTLLRTSRYADLTVEIHSLDTDGSDPLPRYLAKAKITFDAGQKKMDDAIPLVNKSFSSVNC